MDLDLLALRVEALQMTVHTALAALFQRDDTLAPEIREALSELAQGIGRTKRRRSGATLPISKDGVDLASRNIDALDPRMS